MRRRDLFLAAALVACVSSHAWAQESIPDFCASATKTANTGSGNWSSTGTWAGGVVPASTSDKVVVPSGATVTYNASSTTSLKSVCVRSGGTLIFATGSNTKLTLNELIVDAGGTLTVGTSGSPINSANTAEIVFDCVALDTAGIDPEQYGCGLIAMGTVTMHGATRTPFVRLAAEVNDGTASLTLASTPSGWATGDVLVVPDSATRNRFSSNGDIGVAFLAGESFVSHNERRTISSGASTSSLTMTTNWTYDHPGGRDKDGNVDYYPHVGNVTRNVKIYSANPSGVRGHTMYHHMATVDIEYVQFADLGRTTNDDLDCTRRTTGAVQRNSGCTVGTGTVTHVGTNHFGRYAVHFHKLYGPTNVGNTGYQYTFVGNAILDSKKWPIAVHEASYGLIQDNVTAFGFGAAIMLEEGWEFYNTIDHNFMMAQGSGYNADCPIAIANRGGFYCSDPREITDDNEPSGRESSGIWARCGVLNYITNNVAAGFWNKNSTIIREVGYKYFTAASGSTPTGTAYRKPDFRGAMVSSSDYTTIDCRQVPIIAGGFEGNEAYGMGDGFTFWHLNSSNSTPQHAGVSTIKDLVVWNVFDDGVFMYPGAQFTFDGYIQRGTPGIPSIWAITGGDYHSTDVTITNSDIQYAARGIDLSIGWDGNYTVSNTYIFTAGFTGSSLPYQAHGIHIGGYYTPGSGAASSANRVATFTNVTVEKTDSDGYLQYMDSLTTAHGSEYTNADVTLHFEPTLAQTITFTGSAIGSLPSNVRMYFLDQSERSDFFGGAAPCTTTNAGVYRGYACAFSVASKPHAIRRVKVR
jgi:hypothetical protein